eukprot:gnl/Spiro4/18477_TR9892_c0_g1_i1.p1 gnl/Spiro4/18477_TR9892_c0_g1~~gnl/Spiro4/18477_TR9892_c0_g1_i1.p1  ORF type:complete len:702 (+),score=133.10 gnl/Spiro4/18477_TR9892_c0_g1_i1:72-2177(+)
MTFHPSPLGPAMLRTTVRCGNAHASSSPSAAPFRTMARRLFVAASGVLAVCVVGWKTRRFNAVAQTQTTGTALPPHQTQHHPKGFTVPDLQPAWQEESEEALVKIARADAETDTPSIDVLIVGSGLTGSLTAFNLTQSENPPARIVLVDHGQAGVGTGERFWAPPVVVNGHEVPDETGFVNALGEEKVYHPGRSGGVVFSSPHFTDGPTCLKFMVRMYPTTTPEFIEHHGRDVARRFLELAALGIGLEKSICKQLIPNAVRRGVLEEMGSLYLATQEESANMIEEYRLLRELGCNDIEFWEKDRVEALHGPEAQFVNGIFFPNDARIDPLAFVQAVVAATRASTRSHVSTIEHCPSVVDISDRDGHVVTTFADGTKLRSKQVVVATNGLFLNMSLAGILIPCWSYFVALPHPRDPLYPQSSAAQAAAFAPLLKMGGECTHNFFTYGFHQDWCVTRGVFRISGADHFSALKPPRALHHSTSLTDWAIRHYPYMRDLLMANHGDEAPQLPVCPVVGVTAADSHSAAAAAPAASPSPPPGCPMHKPPQQQAPPTPSPPPGCPMHKPQAPVAPPQPPPGCPMHGKPEPITGQKETATGAAAIAYQNDPEAAQRLHQLSEALKGRFVYGVYGETPDRLPLVGKVVPQSNICYVVGCNAWGQSTMTFASSLVPGILGYSTFTPKQAEYARDLAISRFKTQSVYLRDK